MPCIFSLDRGARLVCSTAVRSGFQARLVPTGGRLENCGCRQDRRRRLHEQQSSTQPVHLHEEALQHHGLDKLPATILRRACWYFRNSGDDVDRPSFRSGKRSRYFWASVDAGVQDRGQHLVVGDEVTCRSTAGLRGQSETGSRGVTARTPGAKCDHEHRDSRR